MSPRRVAVSVLGAGSWGTALAISLCSSGHAVTLWARRSAAAAAMRKTRRNPSYLRDAILPETLTITSKLDEAATASTFWVVATPSQAVRKLAQYLLGYATADNTVVSVAKGIENATLQTTTQVLCAVLSPPISAERIGVLSGPSHAEELAAGKPTTIVAAAGSADTAELIQTVFMTNDFRVYLNDDLVGVEVGAAVKNVMAIAAGISDGIGFGVNAKAALLTRGMAEIQRLGVAMGARASTFAGLTGIGDLVVTCTSGLSRNRRVGELIGQGVAPDEAQRRLGMVAEGMHTATSVRALAETYEIEMPITEAVCGILFDGKKPHDAVQDLMTRSAKSEVWLGDASFS